ncbi:MAG: TIM barrel protein [Chitinispirillaceae bacterium]|nr:TIM barrel protein [Chitinispirillaceae bacterium]
MNFKQRYPFRIGCTSYVIPDEILPNVSYMADTVDDIELVLFESGKWSNLPDERTVTSMQHIANKHDITYSVHFPIDCRAGADEREEREKFYQSVNDIIRLTGNLPVSGYLLHLEGLNNENNPDEVQRWKNVCDSFCKSLTDSFPEAGEKICVENLGYAPQLHAEFIGTYNLSHCVDIGHLWMSESDWVEYLNQVIDKTRIIHLHGVVEGTDHQSLKLHTQQEQLQRLMPILHNYSGVVTLEVFSEEATFSSLTHFEELWQRSRL